MMSIVLNEKERAVIQDLQTQEKSCVEKYENMQRLPVIRNSRACFSPFRSRKKNIISL